MIYNTKSIALEFENYLSSKISILKTLPVLHVIQIGDDFASSKYIQYKKLKCEALGLQLNIQKFELDTDPKIIEHYIESIPKSKSGLILQLPIPENCKYLLDKIDYKIDIDLLGPYSEIFNKHKLLTPTIGAIDLVLKQLHYLRRFHTFEGDIRDTHDKLNLAGKIVAIIGQGKLVGSPLLSYLRDRNATIISINKETYNPEKLTKMAHVIISAAGVENLVDKTWISSNTIVIDAATLESNGSQKGDVNKNDVWEHTVLCPSPGGIGRLTILYLIYNLIVFDEIF
jgi:methylenetetrahydrofolate dehydrogenase (NADP+) / methenyltetrahydrofolate cyclohydrolase